MIHIFNLYIGLFSIGWAHPLLSSQSLTDFVRYEKKWEQNRKNQAHCREERKVGSFPYHCFDHLWELLQEPTNTEEVRSLMKAIDQLCTENVHQVKDQAKLGQIILKSHLGEKCQAALEKQRGDLAYREGLELAP